MNNFKLWQEDAPQAYILTDEDLHQELFIMDDPIEFRLAEDDYLQAIKPIYSLGDSGDSWHKAIDRHHRSKLNILPLDSVPGLYVDNLYKQLHCLSSLYVYYILGTGNKAFENNCMNTQRKFDTIVKESLYIEFTAFSIAHNKKGKLEINKTRYICKFEKLQANVTFTEF